MRPAGRKKGRKRGFPFGGRLLYVIIAAVLLCLLVYIVLFHYNGSPNNPSDGQGSTPKAAIVDQLSFFPDSRNQTFVSASRTILETAGFEVDYYNGTDITVESYRGILSHNYALIVFRVHSALEYSGNETTGDVDLFTSELYNETKVSEGGDYFWDAYFEYVVKVYFTFEGPSYFGISPGFVQHSGKFDDATIIMMGCDGLTYDTMAEAFIAKGAEVYVGWNGSVTSDHTDKATVHLLRALLIEKRTVKNAIAETMDEVGPDPSFEDSKLLYYPVGAENYVIPLGRVVFPFQTNGCCLACFQHETERWVTRALKKYILGGHISHDVTCLKNSVLII